MRWLGFAALLAGVLLWAWSIENSAKRNARAFCDSIEIGQDFAGVVQRAKTVGDNRLRLIQDASVLVAFKGVTAFSRHACEVRAEGGKVTSRRYLEVD